MKTNPDGTITLNAYDTWTSCLACGQRVTSNSVHTCSPQLKTLTDEEIEEIAKQYKDVDYTLDDEEPFEVFNHRGFARAILKKASEK
jgi:hypothetical protein